MNPQNSPTLSAYELRRKRDEVVDKFFNKMQRHAMSINAHDEYIVASRGTGKSEGIDARIILRNVWEQCISFLEWYRHGNSLLQSRNVRKLYVTRLGDRSRS